ncbi:hypothetical protein [Pseudonocardia aurantiaca]
MHHRPEGAGHVTDHQFCVHHARKHHDRLLDIGATLDLLSPP